MSSTKKLTLGKLNLSRYGEEVVVSRLDSYRPPPVVIPEPIPIPPAGPPEPLLAVPKPAKKKKKKPPLPRKERIMRAIGKRSTCRITAHAGLGRGMPGVPKSDDHKAAIGLAQRIKRCEEFIVFAPGSTIGEYVHLNMKEYCKERGLCPYTLRGVAKGKFKQHRGYVCSFTKP